MALTFNSPFSQRDVRETPAATATATAVGLVNPTYVTLSNDSDLVNERVLTAGTGIDLSDGGAGSTITISGENASTSNKGIANFNSSDFSTSSGTVSLKNKTSYVSLDATDFRPIESAITYDNPTDWLIRNTTGTTQQFSACVKLPHGAVVTAAIVYGTDTGNTWNMTRITLNGGIGAAMATAVVDTEDTSISNATVDNTLYGYDLSISLGDNDSVEGGRITYTTDYI